jgi:hypothetical protein
MTGYFFDDADEMEEYQLFRRQDQPLLRAYEKLRLALRQAETELQEDPQNQEKAATVAKLQDEVAALERQAPWLNYDYPLEYLLWGPPH